MKTVTIPLHIPSDVLIALNESEQELKAHFQTAIAIMLFQESKLTLGKAIQLSGLSRFEFEKALTKSRIPVVNPTIDQIKADAKKITNL